MWSPPPVYTGRSRFPQSSVGAWWGVAWAWWGRGVAGAQNAMGLLLLLALKLGGGVCVCVCVVCVCVCVCVCVLSVCGVGVVLMASGAL